MRQIVEGANEQSEVMLAVRFVDSHFLSNVYEIDLST